MSLLKRVLLGVAGVVVTLGVAGGIYAGVQGSAFDASMEKVYDVPVPTITLSSDPAVLARGKHLVEAVGACTSGDCHGPALGGGRPLAMGPLGTFQGPNVSSKGALGQYSDGELARLLKHGLKKDGRSLRFMPVQEGTAWLAESEIAAMIAYLRTVPGIDAPSGTSSVGILGKILDRRDAMPLDVARRIDHAHPVGLLPAPTAEYGQHLAGNCQGCHGKRLSGGRIPGAPKNMPVPPNLTPHASGLGPWTYEDFVKFFRTSIKKNGQPLEPFMPMDAFSHLDEVELRALWEYLHSIPALEAGQR